MLLRRLPDMIGNGKKVSISNYWTFQIEIKLEVFSFFIRKTSGYLHTKFQGRIPLLKTEFPSLSYLG